MKWVGVSELNSDLKSLMGEHLIFHCKVREFIVRSSKKGNMFGILEVENGENKTKFFLFGDDFVHFKQYGVKGKQLLIKGRTEKQKFSDNYEFRINEILDVF